jgi:hypothetical protein
MKIDIFLIFVLIVLWVLLESMMEAPGTFSISRFWQFMLKSFEIIKIRSI